MALSTKKQVEEFADRLSQCANDIHVRLMAALKAKEIDQAAAQVAFQQETQLRQQANGLYIDAANLTVQELATPQAELLGVIDSAKGKLANIKKIAAVLDLIADILALAVAASTAKPGPILAAYKEVKKDLDELPTT